MKKYFTLIAAAAMAMVGCTKESAQDVNAQTCSFEVSADQGATKAAIDNDGNGVNVNRFVMEVYLLKNGELQLFDKQTKAPLNTSLSKENPAKAVFTLTLLKDQEYKVLFWADKAKADLSDLYYNTSDLREVKVVADQFCVNNDSLDAFSKVESITKDESRTGFAKSIRLKRPFAQLNFISTDIAKLVENAERTGDDDFIPRKVKLEYYAFSQFDVLNQKASVPGLVEKSADVYSAAPTAQTTQWTMAMAYLATMGTESEVRDAVKMTVYGANDFVLTTVEVSNVPFQRNYRTNIIGSLLTSVNEFEVIVDPLWNPQAQVKRGETITKYDTLQDALANIQPNDEITLLADVDLAGGEWTPVSIAGNTGATFDGNGHTIRNLHISNRANGGKAVGLLSYATGWTIKNLNVDNAHAEGINHVAIIAGNALCTKIENCKVTNSSVKSEVKDNDDGDKAGIICGYLSAEPAAYIKSCTVEDCTVQAYRDLGAIVGYANGSSEVSGNRAKNVQVICDTRLNYKNYTSDSQFDANKIVGEKNSAATVENNTDDNVVVSYLR